MVQMRRCSAAFGFGPLSETPSAGRSKVADQHLHPENPEQP